MNKRKTNNLSLPKSPADYLSGRENIPDGILEMELAGEKTNSEITYYSWDLKFKEDTDAKRNDNSGADEVQVIFNMNRDIRWNIESDKSGTFSNREVLMKKGEVCIYRNNDARTSMRYERDSDFKFKSLQMPTERFEKLVDDCFGDNDREGIKTLVYSDVQSTVITPDMYRILSEIESADRYKEIKGFFLEGKMIELTALILYGIAHKNSGNAGNELIVDSTDAMELEKLRENIQLKPYENYSAEEVAQSLNMSVSKLNRLFRSLYATSLHAYVQSKRLEFAANLLKNEHCSVTEAATKAGYNNMSYFSKAFYAYFKTTPKKYSRFK